MKVSDDSKDQTNESPTPKGVNRNLKNNAPSPFLPEITSSLPSISWAIANANPTPLKVKVETSSGFQASEVMQPTFSSHKKHRRKRKEKKIKKEESKINSSNNGEARDEPLTEGNIDSKVKKFKIFDDSKKGSDDSNDQSTEDGEINDTSDILIISVDSNDTSIISDDSEKGSDDSKDQKIEDGEINDTNQFLITQMIKPRKLNLLLRN